jgi:hypothetical protein
MATEVAQPLGKPAEHRPRGLPGSHCHRASSRPNQPHDEAGTTESTRRAAEWVRNNVSGVTIGPPEVSEGEAYLNF